MLDLPMKKWFAMILISLAGSSGAEELVPFVEIASNQDCGVNCLVIACQLFEIPVEKREVAALAKLSFEGTSLFNLSEAARSKGLHTKTVQWESSQLARWPYLAIAHWENHFVLVTGQTETGAGLAFKIIDPPQMPYCLDQSTFSKNWDGHCLLLSPKPIRAWLFPSTTQSALYTMALVSLTLTAYGIRKAKWPLKRKTL